MIQVVRERLFEFMNACIRHRACLHIGTTRDDLSPFSMPSTTLRRMCGNCAKAVIWNRKEGKPWLRFLRDPMLGCHGNPLHAVV